jgi:hypothetical protein
MRKLVLILIAFIAVITFIRAYDNSVVDYAGINSGRIDTEVIYVDGIYADGINSDDIQPLEE